MSEAVKTLPRTLPLARRAASCAACGAEFSCGAASESGCWCSELRLGEAALAELRAKYDGCLCPDCLARYAARAAEGEEPS